LPLFSIFQFDFGTIPKVWYFLPFILLPLIMVWFMVFNAAFNNISVYRGGFIGGENWSTRRKPRPVGQTLSPYHEK
jgi:hypothetical protein